jgi:hypothetical protein
VNDKHYPEDEFKLPELKIEKLFYLEATLHQEIYTGDTGRGAHRIIYPIKGGFFKGENISGSVMNFGADWYLNCPDKLGVVDTRYLLKTDDGEYISVNTSGLLVMSTEQEALIDSGEFVDPKEYYFRQHLFFETGAEKYKLNSIIAFAIIGIKPTGEICYNAYTVKYAVIQNSS